MFTVGTVHNNYAPTVDCVWNVMAHAQKPNFVVRRNGRVHLNRRGASVHSSTGSRGVRIRDSNAGYTMFRGRVKGTGYPLHSPVSPSPPLVRHRVPSRFNWTLLLEWGDYCLCYISNIQQDATVCRYLFTAKLLYMFRVSIALIKV